MVSAVSTERLKRFEEFVRVLGNPFAEKRFEKNFGSAEFLKKFSYLKPGEEGTERCRIAGRVMGKREHGKISFFTVWDQDGRVQFVFRKDRTEDFEKIKFVDRGDIIGAEGVPCRTSRGELSLLVERWKVLSKSVRPLPDEWFGLKDVEMRYRERYLDFILNPEERKTFVTIHRILSELRNFLDSRGFIEVYTPILQPVYGGAFARPFKTFFHALGEERYLRVSPELYLKRLLVGGFEKVYEVAPCFRNEGIDANHNPEFVQVELYWAYADFRDMMNLTEELISTVVKRVFGTERITYSGKTVDFSVPWKRIRMVDAIKEFGKVDVESMDDGELRSLAAEHGIQAERRGEIVEKLFDHFVKDRIVNPTFVTHFPRDISPLAKSDGKYAERFEVYVAGIEVCNAYTELNDPFEQFRRFREEEELRSKVKKEDFEFMPMDRDFIRALEYGMPPAAGLGIGLWRLFKILCGKSSIKEVNLFPAISRENNIHLISEEVAD